MDEQHAIDYQGTPRMRTIGLLGGMSWESTIEYYRILNAETRSRLGGVHSAPCLLHSFDFAEITALQRAGAWDEAAMRLARAAKGLEAAGAELLLICTNTMHKVAPAVARAVSVPLLDIIEVTADRLRAVGTHRVGLLGTRFTMEDGFYHDSMARHGIELLTPEAEADRALVHRVIFEELAAGIRSDASRDAYRQIIGRLVERGAQGIVLGCTEIELLVTQADSTVPVFPTTRIHAEAAIAASLTTT
jgi:aspartate racemase